MTADQHTVSFFAPGIPGPGGSKKAWVNPKTGRAHVSDAGGKRTKDWRAAVAHVARLEMDGRDLFADAVELEIIFMMPRPKSHFGTGRNADKLKGSAPKFHTKAPDTTKLIRSTEDALKGIVWRDDSQVVVQRAEKQYTCGAAGAHVRITRADRLAI